MPKLYEYLGIVIYFWSNEHDPVHVHGSCQGRESKAELHIEDGQVKEIRIINVKGRSPLDPAELRNFECLVQQKADEIVQKWVDYFVLRKKVSFEKIAGRI